jgi:hypothetical protein
MVAPAVVALAMAIAVPTTIAMIPPAAPAQERIADDYSI